MGFVIGVVVALLVIFLLAFITIKKPVFGEIMIALAVLMIVASTFLYFQKDNRVENKKNLIPLEQIELTDIQHTLAYGNYYKLTAQLNNKSEKYRLQSIRLKLSFLNCDAVKSSDYKNCQLISEKYHTIKTRTPARQTEPVESYFLLDDEAVLAVINTGTVHWKIELLNGFAR
ncbi:MAG: hypothetical protein KZQ64_03740 [gamma proteobacterium symbiont of Bathyaustriella thionipta]|nr:hypothetical protein [gamma proteobacterium symbiont of Bathyaustriella thionipta]MCU7950585.1 hypothetical protein [gamma proteobacterium symbiont of Bathyaustriella thionipta]MCU7952493.1 hypothetical protein [gamma proteobacterium symbiont of Bathyaustriella thionipta]MCU7957093.1 hypothetical protein [gamma proteobacterium symbiont of Bathyaustriella thionipta]MCU7967044.1 hypothetical protein [gamma proteobacterium symbiont of Bathyaustriella thionipta]